MGPLVLELVCVVPEPVTCVVDIPDNTIYLDGEVNGIIDMDYAFSGLDTRNIVKSANSFWMHDPTKDWPREKFYEGYSEERPLPENFEEIEELFRVETLVQLVASLIDMEVLTEDQVEFYEEKIGGGFRIGRCLENFLYCCQFVYYHSFLSSSR